MITAKEIDFLKAQEQFEKICEFVQQAGEQGARVDQVERGLFPQAMEMCLHMLRAFVAAHGDGDEGTELERDDGRLRRLQFSPKPQRSPTLTVVKPHSRHAICG